MNNVKQFASEVRQAIDSVRTELTQSTVARLGVLALLFPLDASKTRLQITASTSKLAVGAARRGPWFNGVLPTLLGHLPNGAVAFGLYTVLHSRLRKRKPDLDTRIVAVAAACAADAATALWLAPAETLKIRLQTGMARNFQGAISVGGSVPGYVNAVVAQVVRDAPFRALHLLMYERARQIVTDRFGNDNKGANDNSSNDGLSSGQAAMVGAAVGAISAAVTTPLDVVRTRLMSQRPGPGQVYQQWAACAVRTVRREGAQALFRGLIPRTVYMALSVALFSVGYEVSRKVMTDEAEAASMKLKEMFSSKRVAQ